MSERQDSLDGAQRWFYGGDPGQDGRGDVACAGDGALQAIDPWGEPAPWRGTGRGAELCACCARLLRRAD